MTECLSRPGLRRAALALAGLQLLPMLAVLHWSPARLQQQFNSVDHHPLLRLPVLNTYIQTKLNSNS